VPRVVALADRIQVLDYGRCLPKAAENVLKHPDVVRAYLGGAEIRR
jgi:ABC-type branched-subunit amino acid transport system ATPase component